MQETQTLFECKGNITIKATVEYTIHFHQKASQKPHQNQNTKSGIGPTWHRADDVADMWFLR